MKKIYSIFIVAALLLAGCEKVIDIDPSQSEPRVVVMSALESGSAIGIHLTYSRFFLDDRTFQEITDADVQFTVNGEVPAEAVTNFSGYYGLSHVLQDGDTVGLRVSVPGHGVCTAATVVPAAAVVTGDSVHSTPEDGKYLVRFTLDDDGSIDNYYSVSLRYEYDTLFEPNYDYNGNLVYDTIVDLYTGDAVLSCNDYLIADQASTLGSVLDEDEVTGFELYFTDRSINGRKYEVKLNAEIYTSVYYYDEGGELLIYSYTSKPRYYLDVVTYSRDRYLYDITSSQYSDDALLSMFEEPVQVHCNIEGGIGIFAARNIKTFLLNNE